ncbi:MerR family transcriptional regulator [Desulfarculus baarsii]
MAEETSTTVSYYTVAQVAAMTGVAASAIRYYDQQFEDYLALTRGPGRRRLFDDAAVARLRELRSLLTEQGLSVRQARQRLANAEHANPPADRLAAMEDKITSLEEQVRELRTIQARTLALVDRLAKGRS